MALERTGPDSLAAYHLGAASHGAAQTDPDLSLGNYLSSTLAPSLAPASATVALGSGQLTINRIEGENGTGTGTITATGNDDVTWTPPGGSAGPSVTILNGQTRMLPGNDPNKFIVVTRDNANNLTTSANVTVVVVYPSAHGGADVDAAEQSAGSTKYRAVGYKNLNSVTVQNFKVKLMKLGTQRTTNVAQLGASGAGTIEISSGTFDDWPASGHAIVMTSAAAIRERVYYSSRTSTVLTVPAAGRGLGVTSAAAGASDDTVDAVPPVELGIEAPASQPSGAYDNPANEDTAPSGVTFSNPVTDAQALTPTDKATNEHFAVRTKRITVAGATNEQNVEVDYTIEYDAA